MCGHTYKHFESSSAPIAIFSEQTQKHCKEHVVMYKSGCDTRARQHRIKESLHGILPHMLRLRNPLVVTDVAKSSVVSGCLGHGARTRLHLGIGVILGQEH